MNYASNSIGSLENIIKITIAQSEFKIEFKMAGKVILIMINSRSKLFKSYLHAKIS